MLFYWHLVHNLCYVVVASPCLLTIILGVSSLLEWKLAEETTARLVEATIVTGLLAAIAVLVAM